MPCKLGGITTCGNSGVDKCCFECEDDDACFHCIDYDKHEFAEECEYYIESEDTWTKRH